jgi:hypothetical protein
MKEKQELLSKEQEAKAELMNKLKAMESKLLTGDGRNIIDHTTEQEKKLQERK